MTTTSKKRISPQIPSEEKQAKLRRIARGSQRAIRYSREANHDY